MRRAVVVAALSAVLSLPADSASAGGTSLPAAARELVAYISSAWATPPSGTPKTVHLFAAVIPPGAKPRDVAFRGAAGQMQLLCSDPQACARLARQRRGACYTVTVGGMASLQPFAVKALAPARADLVALRGGVAKRMCRALHFKYVTMLASAYSRKAFRVLPPKKTAHKLRKTADDALARRLAKLGKPPSSIFKPRAHPHNTAGRVSLHGFHLAGATPARKHEVLGVLSRHITELGYCVQAHGWRSKAGRFVAHWTIRRTGMVARASVHVGAMKPALSKAAHRCVTQAVRRWLFPRLPRPAKAWVLVKVAAPKRH